MQVLEICILNLLLLWEKFNFGTLYVNDAIIFYTNIMYIQLMDVCYTCSVLQCSVPNSTGI